MANVLPTGTSLTQSSTFAVTAGSPATVKLIGPSALSVDAKVWLQFQGSDNAWIDDHMVKPTEVIYGAATWRLDRRGGNVGADVN